MHRRAVRLVLLQLVWIVWGDASPALAQAQFIPLGDRPGGGVASRVTDISGDGAVVIGESDDGTTGGFSPYESFRWTSSGGLEALGPAGDRRLAAAVSFDGSVVVGTLESSGFQEGFRWTELGGVDPLGDLPGGAFDASATDVSADGAVVVGTGNNSGFGTEAFAWAGGGLMGLGDLAGGAFFSRANAISADGTTIVGESESGESADDFSFEAFRWTSQGGMQGLGDLAGGFYQSSAGAVSADGSVVAGTSRATSGDEAFRWTESGGMHGLGDLPGGNVRSFVNDVSADGNVIVGGSASVLASTEAFRWTPQDGMQGLGELPGFGCCSQALAVSADGSTIVGTSVGDAFVWTQAQGMRSVRELLETDFGLDLTGWDLDRAKAVSDDGSRIVGSGFNPDGFAEAWLAILPVPEPSDWLSLVTSLVLVFWLGRRKRLVGRPESAAPADLGNGWATATPRTSCTPESHSLA